MGIFRGIGGTGNSTDDGVVDAVTAQAVIATNKATEAATSATSAYNSAQSASTSKDTATTQANAAQASANTASTHATNASTSATSAATSATSASASATTATTKASEAATSATNAATSETNAATSATTATTKASEAATSATTATTKASEASTSATNAASSATSASTSASTATTKASEASTSAASAASSYDDFDDRYLGAKSSAPSVDNDGDALITGALYFDTTSDSMKVYSGSSWLDAYASLSGALIATNNLSDLNNVSTARTNLGLGTAATTASTDYATAAQGTTADNALPKSGGAMTGAITTNSTFDGRDVSADGAKLDGIEAGATADQTAGEIKTAYESNADTNAFTDADHSKLDGIESGATADQTAAEIRTLVDSATDSNVFTDADHTKLDGIETGATADQTASEILTAIKTVDGTGSGLDADLLDGQEGSYYAAQSNVETYINRSYVDKHDAVNLAVGWYTIAQNTGNRAVARFALWDVNSGDHQSVVFYAAHHYGTDASNTITVLHNSKYVGSPFRYLRIKDAGTYDGAAFQVYIDDASNAVNVAIVGDDVQSDGWDIVDFLPDATAPSLVSNWSSFTEKSRIDLDLIDQGGIATTGEIYAGGDTSQYKVWHSGNDGSASGLDADTCDGQHLGSTASVQFGVVQLYNSTSSTMRTFITGSGDSAAKMYWQKGTTTNLMTLDMSGNLVATGNVTAYSDARLKDNIKPISNALTKLDKISGNTYTRNDLEDTDKKYAGVIAQEVEAVLPEAVVEADDGTKAVDYNATIALLIEAVKELKAEVNKLKGEK